MSGSVSPLPWTGSKGCIYTTIDAFMPPHKTYVEACMGSAEVFLRKKPVEREIINDYNGDLVKFFRVLQQNEKLAYLLGRLYLSFNSEELFRIAWFCGHWHTNKRIDKMHFLFHQFESSESIQELKVMKEMTDEDMRKVKSACEKTRKNLQTDIYGFV